MQNLLCFLGWHDWRKWVFTGEAKLQYLDSDCYGYDQELIDYEVDVYNRVCKNCGEMQSKTKHKI